MAYIYVLPAIIMRQLYLFIIISIIACSNRRRIENKIPKVFDKKAVVNHDSCQRWNLPLTSFSVEFPENYKALFHPGNAYLQLSKYSVDGYVEQEFSFGKSENIQTDDEVEKWLLRADSSFNNLKTYQRKFMGYEQIAGSHMFVINSVINFDSFGQPEYKGDYRILMMIFRSINEANGVSVSVITKSSTDSTKNYHEMDKILATLEIIKK